MVVAGGRAILLVVVCCSVAIDAKLQDTKVLENKLMELINAAQVQEDIPLLPPLRWKQKKGLFPCLAYANLHGDPEKTLLRWVSGLPDNTPSPAGMIMSALLEIYSMGGLKPLEKALTMAVKAYEDFHDKNIGHANSIISYWEQKYNSTVGYWQPDPVTMKVGIPGTMMALAIGKIVDINITQNVIELFVLLPMDKVDTSRIRKECISPEQFSFFSSVVTPFKALVTA